MIGWAEQNQAFLVVALAEIAERLGAASRGEVARLDDLLAEQERLRGEMSTPPGIDVLAYRFGLSEFERRLLLLCAGVELDSTLAGACAAVHGDPRRPFATFSLALSALGDAHWSALTPLAPLRRWRMISVGSGSVTGAALSIDEQILHFVAGVIEPNAQLLGVLEHVPPTAVAAPFHAGASARVRAVWTAPDPPIVLLAGADLASKQDVAARAAAELGLELHVLRVTEIPEAAADRQALVQLWSREARLVPSALLVDPGANDEALRREPVRSFLRSVEGAVAVMVRDALPDLGRPAAQVHVDKPDAASRLVLWRTELDALDVGYDGEVHRIAGQFELGPADIRAAAVAGVGATSDGRGLPEALWDACRAQARPRLDDLAQRIEPRAGWDDLVLPDTQLALLRQVGAHVRQRLKVYEEWGFGRKSTRGLGISALFSGPSGTGKTMAAEVLANELGLDLYRIDISSVVSKYIGETEKNLRQVFDAAESGGAVLLFDEADALFGKRSEVKDSRDRYANIEVGYLLQRMEAYQGLAILTTNLRNNLDGAFLRRIRFSVKFPFPDHEERRGIWARTLPEALPRDGLDFERLAQLKVAGGNIRNIAMNAAFLAADEDRPMGMHHVLQAARAEYAKLDKTLSTQEVAGWP